MPNGHQFEHLPLVLRDRGPARFSPPPRSAQATAANRQNRATHRASLATQAGDVVLQWQARHGLRAQQGLPEIPAGIPLLLKIDPSLDLDDLRHFFAFEVVSEQEDGFVIVSTADITLAAFQQKLNDFAAQVDGSASVAAVHELVRDPNQDERLRRILSDSLLAEWPNLIDNGVYICDVSIACTGDWQIPRKPKRGRMTDENWARKEAEWSRSRSEAYDKWDALQTTRLESMANIISGHQGEMLQIVHDDTGALLLPDSFTVRLKISGMGLRDFVLNYPYVFEVVEPDDIETPQQVQRNEAAIAARMTFVAPPAEAPAVCIIDSGLQEGHLWLETAIDKPSSRCFLPATSATEVADYVPGGGHGTRVAGAVLYGNSIPKDGTQRRELFGQD